MDDKLKKAKAFLTKVNTKMKKQYGGENVLYAGDEVGNFNPLPTGFPTIDHCNSGIGGLPRGGVTLIHGLESTGKSTLILECIEHAMNLDDNFMGLYIDVENALTEDFLRFKGIDPSKLVVTPLNTEDALNIAKDAIKENIYDIIVIDSLAKLDSKNMVDGDIGDKKQRNQRAKIITEFLRVISFTLRASNTALVLINQEIENQDKKTPYDPDTVLPCGKQQVYSANLRLQIKRSKKIKKGDVVVGYMCSVTSIKNKISGNERARSYLSYLYNRGFLREISIIDHMINLGVLEKGRGNYTFVDQKYYQGAFKINAIYDILEDIKLNHDVDFTQMTNENFDIDAEETETGVVDDD